MWTSALLGLPVAFVLWSVNLLAGLLVALAALSASLLGRALAPR